MRNAALNHMNTIMFLQKVWSFIWVSRAGVSTEQTLAHWICRVHGDLDKDVLRLSRGDTMETIFSSTRWLLRRPTFLIAEIECCWKLSCFMHNLLSVVLHQLSLDPFTIYIAAFAMSF